MSSCDANIKLLMWNNGLNHLSSLFSTVFIFVSVDDYLFTWSLADIDHLELLKGKEREY